MNKYIYQFALLAAIVTLVLLIAAGISVLTSLFRAAIVFIGVLFIFFVAGQLLRLGITITQPKIHTKDRKS